MAEKRLDYLSWDEYFMATAFLSAMRSKDPATQVGAVIVDGSKRIVGIGYNGMPRGCDDDALPWGKTSSAYLETKYAYVCHAEMNAVLNRIAADINRCSIYVALFPCNECAKIIIQAGIKEIIYYSDKHAHKDSTKASKRMLQLAGIRYRQFVPERKVVTIDFTVIDGNAKISAENEQKGEETNGDEKICDETSNSDETSDDEMKRHRDEKNGENCI